MSSNWSEQQRAKAEIRKENRERERVGRDTLGKYYYDLSKLTFTALCLGGGVSLMSDFSNSNYWLLAVFGTFASFIFAYIGYKILKL